LGDRKDIQSVINPFHQSKRFSSKTGAAGGCKGEPGDPGSPGKMAIRWK